MRTAGRASRGIVGEITKRARTIQPPACRGREPGYPGPPAQIPACGFPAPGSCRRSNAIGVRGLGGPCTSNPLARSFWDMPSPALCPGHALLLTFPSTGRLPSTISAADLKPALFEASQVSGRRRRPLKGSPPSAAQTGRAVFPHPAFMNGFSRSEERGSVKQG
jgi:hypothetical protein